MNTLPEAPDVPEVQAVDSAAPAEQPKPVRRRRATPAAEQAAEAVVAADPAEAADPGAAPAPKPRRRKVAAKAAETEVVASADAAPASPAAAVEPAAEPALEAPAPAVVAAPVEAAAPRAETVAEGAMQGSAEASPEGPAETSAEGAAAGPDGEPRGDRSRRRNRRDRRRGEGRPGRDGEPAAEGDAETPAPAGAVPSPATPDTGELFAHVLSGGFDAEETTEPAAEEPAVHRRVLAPEPESPKLHKVLAQAGIGSRRDMEEMILEGRISVNGQPAHIGQRISFGDQVKVNGKPVRFRIVPPPPRVIAYHKPVGEVVTHDDPQQRPTVFRRLPRLQQGKWQSVGRLDINTEGLLLFTNSGELANQLMHPRFGVEREYAVRVLGTLNEEQKARLLEGVEIEGQTAGFRSIEDGGGEGANHWYRVVITEGRNREVRKLFDAVGLAVSRLIRIRYGTVVLPRGLKRGVWVDLDENDVRTIRRLAGGDRQQQPQQGQQRDNNERRGERGDRGDQRNEQRHNEQRNGEPRNNEQRNERQGKKQRGDNRGQQGGGDRPRQPVQQPQQAQQPPAERRDDDDFEDGLDIDPSRIPNPLEQTFDKRFVQKPRSGVGGRGFSRGGGGFGAGGSAPAPAAKKRGGPQQPDPMQTSVGYIGADAFHRKNRGGRGGGGGGGFGGGGGGGFGGGGRKGR